MSIRSSKLHCVPLFYAPPDARRLAGLKHMHFASAINQISKFMNKEYLNRITDRLAELFCPYGYLDIKRACEVAIEVDENEKWVFEQIDNFSKDCATPYEKIDPVYCVYDSILHEARSEISDLTNFDFCNDMKSGEIYTYGNFMCTSYDFYEESLEQLKQVLKDRRVKQKLLSKKTQWFLSEIGVNI